MVFSNFFLIWWSMTDLAKLLLDSNWITISSNFVNGDLNILRCIRWRKINVLTLSRPKNEDSRYYWSKQSCFYHPHRPDENLNGQHFPTVFKKNPFSLLIWNHFEKILLFVSFGWSLFKLFDTFHRFEVFVLSC